MWLRNRVMSALRNVIWVRSRNVSKKGQQKSLFGKHTNNCRALCSLTPIQLILRDVNNPSLIYIYIYKHNVRNLISLMFS